MATGIRQLDRSVLVTAEWLNEIQKELGWEDKEMVYSATKAFLQTLRDRLTIEEAVQFSAQLPAVMKGIYFDGYKPAGKPDKMNLNEFFKKIQERTVNQPVDPEETTKAMFSFLAGKVSGGELTDVLVNLPKEFTNFLAEA